jgi:hypothetical protein
MEEYVLLGHVNVNLGIDVDDEFQHVIHWEMNRIKASRLQVEYILVSIDVKFKCVRYIAICENLHSDYVVLCSNAKALRILCRFLGQKFLEMLCHILLEVDINCVKIKVDNIVDHAILVDDRTLDVRVNCHLQVTIVDLVIQVI